MTIKRSYSFGYDLQQDRLHIVDYNANNPQTALCGDDGPYEFDAAYSNNFFRQAVELYKDKVNFTNLNISQEKGWYKAHNEEALHWLQIYFNTVKTLIENDLHLLGKQTTFCRECRPLLK